MRPTTHNPKSIEPIVYVAPSHTVLLPITRVSAYQRLDGPGHVTARQQREQERQVHPADHLVRTRTYIRVRADWCGISPGVN
jgi:hypothetical protein